MKRGMVHPIMQRLGRLGVKCPLKSPNVEDKLTNHPENPIDDSITGWWLNLPL